MDTWERTHHRCWHRHIIGQRALYLLNRCLAMLLWRYQCRSCGTIRKVKLENSCTVYPWDGQGPDPNAPVPLCPVCADEHYEHWAEMWSYARGW